MIIHGDCIEEMKKLKPKSIDLVVTSPPYDNLRTYEVSLDWGEHVWKPCIQELYRIVKDGGVVVWVVGDATINGSETGTSFRQALYAMDCGFNLHDTMIYQKNSYPFPPVNRYYQQFEYMFVFSKGKPKTHNIQRCPTIEKYRNTTNTTSSQRGKDGETTKLKYATGLDTRKMDNVWKIDAGYMRGTKDKIAFKHPATFPDLVAERHILSWSNKGDTILDPFAGSGTVGKMAKQLKRNYILIEKEAKYIEIIKERLQSELFKEMS